MENKHSGQWERLDAVIKWTGMSTHAFASHLGLKRSENLYRIKSKKNGISRKLVELIVRVYPEINDIWLMVGGGTMLKSVGYVNVIEVPYYAEGIGQYLKTPESCSSKYVIPVTYGAEIAIEVDDTIINDIVPRGTVALLKKIDIVEIVYGRPYYVVTEFFNEFCIVEESSNPEEISLCGRIFESMAENNKAPKINDEHDEIKMLKSRIKELKARIAIKENNADGSRTEGGTYIEFNSNDQSVTSIDRISINSVFAICGYVKML